VHETFLAALAIVSGISGLLLAWLNYRRDATANVLKATSELVDDVDRVRKALKEENERLARQIDQLRKQLLQERHKRIALEERLDIERELFSRRISELERQLEELTTVVANNTTDHK
jgi:predicted RNase H-like nuclease (RuvC/YqgF family)